MALERKTVSLNIPGLGTGQIVTVNDAKLFWPVIREALTAEIKNIGLTEETAQRAIGNQLSGMEIDGVRVKARGMNEMSAEEVRRAITYVNRRVRFFYQGNMELLQEAVSAIWGAIETHTRRHSLTGETLRSFYFIGYGGPGAWTGRMTYGETLTWLSQQTHPMTSVRIEGPQTPYRRKFIYLYANDRYKSGKKAGQYRTESIRRPSVQGGYPDRGDPEIRPGSISAGITSKGKGYVKFTGYKAYLKTIAQRYKGQYRDLWIGYRFVPSREPLWSYPSRQGMRPWGRNLPQIFIGLKPGRLN